MKTWRTPSSLLSRSYDKKSSTTDITDEIEYVEQQPNVVPEMSSQIPKGPINNNTLLPERERRQNGCC